MARHENLAGMLRVLLLSELAKGENYGFGMAAGLAELSGGQVKIRAESLYPVLHRMDQEGFLQQPWVEADNGRPRKLYSITPKGRKEWEKTGTSFILQSLAALKALGTAAKIVG